MTTTSEYYQYTYEQLKYIAESGLIKSLKIDSSNTEIVSDGDVSIYDAVNFAAAIWDGNDIDSSLEIAVITGLKTGSESLVFHLADKIGYISGTSIGAAVGSVVPLVGTIAGAFVGGFIGSVVGQSAAKNLTESIFLTPNESDFLTSVVKEEFKRHDICDDSIKDRIINERLNDIIGSRERITLPPTAKWIEVLQRLINGSSKDVKIDSQLRRRHFLLKRSSLLAKYNISAAQMVTIMQTVHQLKKRIII
ncbi:MAG: hypothetical protein IJ563_12760 [Selenomonadaceae bacterium]|nr:hypothetical protein [Selenomonadaceae bacterium]